jgi:hypothetical protein
VRLGLFLVAVIGIPALIGLSVGDWSAKDQPPAPSSPAPKATTLTTSPAPPTRTLIRSAPAVNVYAYENAAGETVEETENRQGQLINRRFYRPALPACAYLNGVGLGTGRYWRDDGEPFFHCLSPMTELGTAAEPHGVGLKNNLAYYVDGDAERAHDLLLKLNVNQRQEAKPAQQALVRAAKALTRLCQNWRHKGEIDGVGPRNVGLRCRHQAHQVGEPLLMNGSSLREGERLIAVGLGAQKGSHLVEQAAEARSHGAMFEPAHGAIPLFDPAMILLQMVIQVSIGPMLHLVPEDMANGTWVRIVTIRGDALRGHASARPRSTEERLRRGEVAGVAEAHVHEVPVSINRPVEVLPPPVNTHIGLVHVPTGSHRAVAPLP